MDDTSAVYQDEMAAARDTKFWFVDAVRHSKEQAGRFTLGLWLWKLNYPPAVDLSRWP